MSLVRLGERDGFGRFGDLDDDGSTVLCHECGRRLKSIAAHVVRIHDMAARDYKVRHGLPLGQPLCSRAVSERMSAALRQIRGADYMRAIATKIDQTVAAQHHRDTLAEYRDAFTSGSRAQRRHLTRRDKIWTCPGCGAQWCTLATTDAPRITCSEPCRLAVGAQRRKLTATARATRDADIRREINRRGRTPRDVAREYALPVVAIRRILAANPPATHDGFANILTGAQTFSPTRQHTVAAPPIPLIRTEAN